nr:hypothetical protein [uncultured Acetatifactor sp.]
MLGEDSVFLYAQARAEAVCRLGGARRVGEKGIPLLDYLEFFRIIFEEIG